MSHVSSQFLPQGISKYLLMPTKKHTVLIYKVNMESEISYIIYKSQILGLPKAARISRNKLEYSNLSENDSN